MTTKAGGGDGHSPDPLAVGLPGVLLARVTSIVAIQYERTLILAAEGSASGFDGTIEIVQSPTRPKFYIVEQPGNCGIIGDCVDRKVRAARAFDGAFTSIQVETADGIAYPKIHSVPKPEATAVQGMDVDAVSKNDSDATEPPLPAAWINFMRGPNARRTLHVRAEFIMPTPGYKLALVRAEPQGINPSVLLLDLKIEPPAGHTLKVLTATLARYDDEQQYYRAVHIRGTDITIDVKIAF